MQYTHASVRGSVIQKLFQEVLQRRFDVRALSMTVSTHTLLLSLAGSLS